MHNNTVTLVEFCAGYGGLGLGIKRILGDRLQLVGLCELEGFAQANLISKMEAGLMAQVPIWSDLRSFPYAKFRGLVDIAAAGIPCQPHSHAGKRKGGSDERFLFDDWLTGLEQMQPRCIFIENVEGLLSSKMPDGSLCIAWTAERLESMGYQVAAGIFSASEVGAPHQRKRVFVLAKRMGDTSSIRLCGSSQIAGEAGTNQSREKCRLHESEGAGALSRHGSQQEELAHDQSLGIQGCWSSWLQESRSHAGKTLPVCGGDAGGDVWPSRPGEPQHGWEPPRVVGGQLENTDQLRLEEHGLQHAGLPVGSGGGQDAEAMGNAMLSGSSPQRPSGRQQDGFGQPSDTAMGNVASEGSQGKSRRELRQLKQEQEPEQSDGESSDQRQTESALGRDFARGCNGLDLSELSGLSDSELAEIREWMVCGDNRTDELRLLGNGVCVPTVTKAWLTLYRELQ